MTLQAFLDRTAILNTLAVHSRGVDRADAILLGAAYHADATVDYGFFAGPAAQFVPILAGAQKGPLPTLHRTANIDVRVAGDAALSESYVIAYAEDPEIQRMIFGRYLDRLERRGGEWRIAHRQYVMDGNTNRPTTVQRGDPSASLANYLPEGGKGASDPGRALLALHRASARSRPQACPQACQGNTTMTADQAALGAALSRDAIRKLVTGYCRAVDRGDKELMASIFWEDSTVISGVVNGTGAEFADQVINYVTSSLDYCFHSVANEWIEVEGDRAIGEHYVIAHNSANGEDAMTGGRYIDAYERRDGVWKIRSRTFVADWNTVHPTAMALDGMYEPLKTRGSFGRSDPVYAHWASL